VLEEGEWRGRGRRGSRWRTGKAKRGGSLRNEKYGGCRDEAEWGNAVTEKSEEAEGNLLGTRKRQGATIESPECLIRNPQLFHRFFFLNVTKWRRFLNSIPPNPTF